MMVYNATWLRGSIADRMRRAAVYAGPWNGTMDRRGQGVFRRCAAQYAPTGCQLQFTRDEGMHSVGWWKNPDYERCEHLSLSFVDPLSGERRPFDLDEAQRWVEAFWPRSHRWTWHEPPYSAIGKRCDVHHFRLFCTPAWTPMKPRGEVYGREFTERGWKSYSQLMAAREAERGEQPPEQHNGSRA